MENKLIVFWSFLIFSLNTNSQNIAINIGSSQTYISNNFLSPSLKNNVTFQKNYFTRLLCLNYPVNNLGIDFFINKKRSSIGLSYELLTLQYEGRYNTKDNYTGYNYYSRKFNLHKIGLQLNHYLYRNKFMNIPICVRFVKFTNPDAVVRNSKFTNHGVANYTPDVFTLSKSGSAFLNLFDLELGGEMNIRLIEIKKKHSLYFRCSYYFSLSRELEFTSYWPDKGSPNFSFFPYFRTIGFGLQYR